MQKQNPHNITNFLMRKAWKNSRHRIQSNDFSYVETTEQRHRYTLRIKKQIAG